VYEVVEWKYVTFLLRLPVAVKLWLRAHFVQYFMP
jgi:hypothetical protein